MKRVSSILLSIILLYANLALANTIDLQQQRLVIIKKYVSYLGQGKFKYMPLLFSKAASVIPKSGLPDSPNHFYNTILTSTHAETNTSLLNIFKGEINNNMFIVYFTFKWKTPDGKYHSENFLDLILFDQHSVQIKKLLVLGAFSGV